jgi:hypothetical protein
MSGEATFYSIRRQSAIPVLSNMLAGRHRLGFSTCAMCAGHIQSIREANATVITAAHTRRGDVRHRGDRGQRAHRFSLFFPPVIGEFGWSAASPPARSRSAFWFGRGQPVDRADVAPTK